MNEQAPAPVVAPLSGEQRAELKKVIALHFYQGRRVRLGASDKAWRLYREAAEPATVAALLAQLEAAEARLTFDLPDNVVAMPVGQRTEIKRLAGARKEFAALNEAEYYEHLSHSLSNEKAYAAALSPDVVLATLDYVAALEAALALAREEAAEAERRAGKPVNTMSAAWCAARLLPIRHYLNNVQAKDPERFEWRAWLIELLNQVDNPPAAPVQSGEKEGGPVEEWVSVEDRLPAGRAKVRIADGLEAVAVCKKTDQGIPYFLCVEWDNEHFSPHMVVGNVVEWCEEKPAGALLERREEGRADG